MIVNLENWCILPTPMGDFRMYDTGDEELRVVCFGDLSEQGGKPLLRLHSSCLASEVFGAQDCDCADQLRESMRRIARNRRGIVIHLHQEGRGQGLSKKIEAVKAMQERGLDTVEAFEALGLKQDTRRYTKAIEVLEYLGIKAVRLISNNPAKRRFLKEHGLKVDMVNTHPKIRPENEDYLRAKKAKLDHRLLFDFKEVGEGEILFYYSDQPWGEFSNFSRHSVFLHGKVWPTVEHFYQAQKYKGTTHEEYIRRATTPMLAKQRAKKLEKECRQDWDAKKEEVMLEGLRAKFSQHPDLGKILATTGSRILVEHTDRDAYWGDNGDGSGLNRLGYLLMQVRNELREGS